MLSPDRIRGPTRLLATAADYDVVRRAVAHIRGNWRTQPEIADIAEAAGVSPTDLHHLFRRWAGISPKAFVQALTLDHARMLLRESASVLEASYEVGLSGPGRLHDLFVTHEAMSPGEWKNGGAGLMLRYGFHPSPFGTAIVIGTDRGLAGLAFADPGEEQSAFADMTRRWPNATYVEDRDGTVALAQRVIAEGMKGADLRKRLKIRQVFAHAALHFLGSFVGEGERQNIFRLHAVTRISPAQGAVRAQQHRPPGLVQRQSGRDSFSPERAGKADLIRRRIADATAERINQQLRTRR